MTRLGATRICGDISQPLCKSQEIHALRLIPPTEWNSKCRPTGPTAGRGPRERHEWASAIGESEPADFTALAAAAGATLFIWAARGGGEQARPFALIHNSGEVLPPTGALIPCGLWPKRGVGPATSWGRQGRELMSWSWSSCAGWALTDPASVATVLFLWWGGMRGGHTIGALAGVTQAFREGSARCRKAPSGCCCCCLCWANGIVSAKIDKSSIGELEAGCDDEQLEDGLSMPGGVLGGEKPLNDENPLSLHRFWFMLICIVSGRMSFNPPRFSINFFKLSSLSSSLWPAVGKPGTLCRFESGVLRNEDIPSTERLSEGKGWLRVLPSFTAWWGSSHRAMGVLA